MRRSGGLLIAAGILALVGAAAGMGLLAPDRYGLPPIEVLDPGPSGERVNEAGLFGNFFPGPGPGPRPGVLLLGGSEGGLGRGAHQMALALQGEGFAVLHLAYFGAPGQPDSLERIPLEGFGRALAWLGARPGVAADRLAVVGASKGAEAALLVAARTPGLRAVVAGMPSSVAWNGIDWARSGQSPHSSWTVGGREVPTMPFGSWNQAEGVISVYRTVEDPAQLAAAPSAAIPIERAAAPVLLVCGEAETMWPACPMARQVAARSAARGGPPVSILAYADAGHLVFGPPVAPDSPFHSRLDVLGGTVAGNAAARADSWPKVARFLKAALGPTG